MKFLAIFLKKTSDLDELRNKIISEVIRNPVYVDLITEVLYHGIRDFMSSNPLTKKNPWRFFNDEAGKISDG